MKERKKRRGEKVCRRDRGEEGKLAWPGTMNLARGNKSRIVASISTKLAPTCHARTHAHTQINTHKHTHARAQLALLISSPNKSRLARGTRLRERVSCRPFTRKKEGTILQVKGTWRRRRRRRRWRRSNVRVSSRGGPAQEMGIVSLGWPLGRPSQPKPGERSWPASLLFVPPFLFHPASSLISPLPRIERLVAVPPPRVFILSVLCAVLLLRRAKMVHGRS